MELTLLGLPHTKQPGIALELAVEDPTGVLFSFFSGEKSELDVWEAFRIRLAAADGLNSDES